MIWHLVMWRVKGEGEEKRRNMEEIVKMLRQLKEVIPEVKVLHTGVNFSTSSSAFDVGLITGFSSNVDLENYKIHPVHLKIVERIRKLTLKAIVVDFED